MSAAARATSPLSGRRGARDRFGHGPAVRRPVEPEILFTVNILVPNLGSTSLKYQILEMPGEQVLARGKQERVADYGEALSAISAEGVPIEAIALKAVHGGPRYRGTFVVDDGVIGALREFLPAAPVHNAIYLDAIRSFRAAMPDLPMVAAFETEFHATMPPYASVYGVPGEWRKEHGIARYGFHGASHQYIAERVKAERLVSCHLGGSSSMCAIRNGRSIDTTMGFSPQSGLENATRHGDVDVFAVLFMMEKAGLSIADVRRSLAGSGGLAGLSGIAGGDVRDLEAAAETGNHHAALALAVFTYQVRKTIGAYGAVLGGLDTIAFTGGIGENSARLRAACCKGLEYMGVKIDPERNQQEASEKVVSAVDSSVTVVALPTNEELIVARRAYRVLKS
jgi:acetate kinase